MTGEARQPGESRAVRPGGGDTGGAAPARRAAAALLALAALLGGVLWALPEPWTLPSGAGFASPDGRPLRDTVFAAVWWVAAGSVVVSLLLAASARVWARPAAPPPARGRPPALVRTGVALLLAAAALAVGLRLPLASGSLWWDEAWSMRRVVTGEARPSAADPDRLEGEQPPWSRPLWDYRKPTNHVVYNLLGRAAIDAWQAARGAESWAFDELVFRLPALAASAAAVVALGVLVARLGFPRAGVVAAFWLAIHPWHLRYGAEGRAYGLVLLLAIGAGLALLRAWRRGGWVEWLGVGAVLGLLVWCQPSSVYLVTCLGAAAALGIATDGGAPRDRVTRGMRLAVSGAVTLMGVALVMAPNVAQSLAWTDVFQDEGRIGRVVLVDLWGTLATGIQVWPGEEADPPEAFPALELLARSRPWLDAVVFAGLPLLAAGGLVRIARRSSRGVLVLGAITAGVALALVTTWAQNLYYYHRFVIHALVPVVAGCAVGADGVAAALARRASPRARGALAVAILVAALLAYQAVVWPQTRMLLTRPIAPMAEAAAVLRGAAGERPSSVLRGGLGLGGEMPALYDPWLRDLQTPEAFFALAHRARDEGRPFWVTYAYPGQNRPRFPEVFARLDDPACFELVAEFRGVEPPYHYRVLRWRGPEEGAGACLSSPRS